MRMNRKQKHTNTLAQAFLNFCANGVVNIFLLSYTLQPRIELYSLAYRCAYRLAHKQCTNKHC